MSFPHDPGQFRDIAPADLSGLRVAVTEDLGFAPVQNAIRKTFRDTLTRYSSVFACCEDRGPADGACGGYLLDITRPAFVATQKDHFDNFRDQLGDNVAFNTEAGLGMNMEQAGWAHREHGALYQRFQAYFAEFDLMICPGVPVPPFALDQPAPSGNRWRKDGALHQCIGNHRRTDPDRASGRCAAVWL